MNLIFATAEVTPLDIIAVILFLGAWFGYGYYAEHMYPHKRNLLRAMNDYRHQWMREMLKRDNRMVDAAMVGNLLRSISFFASTSIFIIAGMVTLLSYRDKALNVIEAIPFAAGSSALLWEAKVLLLSFIFIYAFFKFTWALRQYIYACIFIGAAPGPDVRVEEHEHLAAQGARLTINAARHFNMGLRAYYYGMAALAWFVHPVIFLLATALVVFVLYRREFLSKTLASVV